MTAKKPAEPTLVEIEAQIADLNAKKVDLEKAAAADLIPIYGEIVELVNSDTLTVNQVVERLAELKSALPAGSIAEQQAGHLATVVDGVLMFFSAEKRRLEALVEPPPPVQQA